VLPVPKSQEESAQEQADRESEASTKRWTIWMTGLTVIVGAGQILMILRQANIAKRQNEIIERQNTIMTGQREAADTQSTYMRDGLELTKQAAEAAQESADVARNSVLMTHRPKIIVREIIMPEATELFLVGIDGAAKTMERVIADAVRRHERYVPAIAILDGSFRLTNKGSSAAILRLVERTIYLAESLPPENPCFGKSTTMARAEMPSGFTSRVDFETVTITLDQIGQIRREEVAIYVIGKIIYTDGLGNARRTGFARRFNMRTGRFDIVKDDPDYEYVD
jgi:hypothetical protein